MCSERRKKAFSLLYTKIKHGFLANQSVHRVLSILKFSVNSRQNIEISIEMKSLTLYFVYCDHLGEGSSEKNCCW